MARKDFELQIDVDIDDINLDPENARIRSGASQEECIAKVLRKSDQLIVLMKGIVNDGLSTMPILLTPDKAESGKWIVKDGNRRITALKLLNKPELCQDIVLREKIIQIIDSSSYIPTMVDCYSSTNQDSIMKEVIARHSGAQAGAGQLDWSSYLRTFYLLNNDQYSEYKRAGQYCLWAENHSVFIDDDFPITNISRFLNSKNLEMIGFKVVEDEIVGYLPEDQLIGMARKIISDFTNKLLRVADVWQDEQAKEYLKTVRQSVGLAPEIISTPPASNETNTPPNGNNSAANTSSPETGENPDNKPNTPMTGASPGGQTGNRKAAWDRNKLFHNGSAKPIIPFAHTKARTIIAEIGQLNIKKTPLSVCLLLRGLIELSTNQFIAANSLKDHQKLAKNVSSAAEVMIGLNLINESQLDLIKRYCNSDPNHQGLLHLETLQKYVHRDTHQPNYQTLNTFWDEFGCYIRACWG